MSRNTKKNDVRRRAISGLPLPDDVVVVSRSKRAVRFRHSWPEHEDARVWDALMSTALSVAQRAALQTGKEVMIVFSDGATARNIRGDE